MVKIKFAANKLGISDQDIMRMAVSIGLEALKRVDWDFAKLVCDAALPQFPEETGAVSPWAALHAAEDPPSPPSKKAK